MSGIFRHRGVQLILAFIWARPAILVAGKGRAGNIFISSVSLSFLFIFLPCPSIPFPQLSLLSLFSLSLGDNTRWPTRVNVSLNATQSIKLSVFSIRFYWKFGFFDCMNRNCDFVVPHGVNLPIKWWNIITKTCLYNFDPLKPHFYIVKHGFTGVCTIFSYFCSKHRLWVLVRTASSRRF